MVGARCLHPCGMHPAAHFAPLWVLFIANADARLTALAARCMGYSAVACFF